MSDDDTNDRDDPEREESGGEDRSRGFHLEAGLRSLSSLLGDLIEVNVNESPPPPAESVDWSNVDESEGEQRSDDRSRRKRTVRVRKAESEECLIDTHFDDDEFVVTADVRGTNKDELSVGIDPKTNDLVIGKDGSVLARVPLPWQSPETTNVWFNNGILEVRMRSTEP